jgi:hypothetical protein
MTPGYSENFSVITPAHLVNFPGNQPSVLEYVFMKFVKPVAALTLALLLATVSLGQNGKPAAGQGGLPPKIVIESPSYDFGEIKAGTPLRHTFKVRNEGKGELRILNVAPS